MAVIGGTQSYLGGLASSIILTILPEALRVTGETNLRLIIYGAMVLVVFRFFPAGLGGVLEKLLARKTTEAAPDAAAASEWGKVDEEQRVARSALSREH